MPDAPMLVDPATCAIVRLETGFHVGGAHTASTLLEWTSDARFHRFDVRSPRVVRFADLQTATQALQVRTDELLAAGYVQRGAPFRELLAHHEPWLTWNRAATSPEPLLELWKGLAREADLKAASRGMRVVAVHDHELHVATGSGLMKCALPLSPDEFGEAPWFLTPLLTRHVAIGLGNLGFSWDPAEPESLMSLVDGELWWLDEQLVRDSGDQQVVLPTAPDTIMALMLRQLSGG